MAFKEFVPPPGNCASLGMGISIYPCTKGGHSGGRITFGVLACRELGIKKGPVSFFIDAESNFLGIKMCEEGRFNILSTGDYCHCQCSPLVRELRITEKITAPLSRCEDGMLIARLPEGNSDA